MIQMHPISSPHIHNGRQRDGPMIHIDGCIGGFEYDSGVVMPPFIPRGNYHEACYHHAHHDYMHNS